MNNKDLLYEAEVKKKVIQEQIILLRGQYDSQVQIIALLKEEIEKAEKIKRLAARHGNCGELIHPIETKDKIGLLGGCVIGSKGYILGRAAVARKRPVDLDDDFEDHVRTADPQTRMRLID